MTFIMSKDLTKLRKSRAANRRIILGLCTKAKDGLDDDNFDDEKKTHVESILDTLKAKMKAITLTNDQILDFLEEEDEIATDADESTNFDVKVGAEIKSIERRLKMNDEPSHDSSFTSSTSSKSSDVKNRVKLPKLEIKKFSGDPLTWQTFLESFECAVDQNDGLSSVQKMNYLINLVSGVAAETISGLSLSNENYTTALELLKNRFGDKQLIISSYMNKLLETETVRHVSDIKKIRKLFDQIESQVRSLKSLGLDAKNYGPMLIPVIMSKLPDEIKLIISRKLIKTYGTLQLFWKYLEKNFRLVKNSLLCIIDLRVRTLEMNFRLVPLIYTVTVGVKNFTVLFVEKITNLRPVLLYLTFKLDVKL